MSEILYDFEYLTAEDKFIKLMKCDDVEVIWNLGKFITETVKIRGKLWWNGILFGSTWYKYVCLIFL